MSIDFDKIDKNIYSPNSPYYKGSCSNIAISVIALTILAGCTMGSVYLIVKGLPFGSPKSLGGAVLGASAMVGGTAGFIGYRFKVKKLEETTAKLFDLIVLLSDKGSLSSYSDKIPSAQQEAKNFFFNKNVTIHPENVQIKCFSDKEFIKRVKELLNDRDLNTKVSQLFSLIHSYNIQHCPYQFLANQIKALDEQTKRSVLSLSSPDGITLIKNMMLAICSKKETFTSFYTLIPVVTKKEVLKLLASKQLLANSFHLALKLTPNFPEILKDIFPENALEAETFEEALVLAFRQEVYENQKKEVPSAGDFLCKLYPFLKSERSRVYAFALDVAQINDEQPIEILADAITKTKFANQHPEEFETAFFSPRIRDEVILFLRTKLKREDSSLRPPLNAICKTLKKPSLFSLFVSYVQGKWTKEQMSHFKNLSLLDGVFKELLAIDPGFIQIWLLDRKESIPKICDSFIQGKPRYWELMAFFAGLNLKQKFQWIQSKERADFIKTANDWFRFDHFFKKHVVNFDPKTAHFSFDLHATPLTYDLYLIWEDILRQKNKGEWLRYYYEWAKKENHPEIIELIESESILDGIDYKTNVAKEESKEAATNEPYPIKTTEKDVICAIEQLGLDSKKPYSKVALRKILIDRHPDHSKGSKVGSEEYQNIVRRVKLIISYMNEHNLEASPTKM